MASVDLQHSAIPEDQLHEVKGASTASNDTWLKALGDGTTTFEALPEYNLIISDIYVAESFTNQTIDTEGGEATILYDNTGTSPGGNITLDSNGIMTFNTAGTYFAQGAATAYRTTSTGTCTLAIAARINGVQTGRTAIVILDNSSTVNGGPLSTSNILQVAAGDTLTFEMLALSLPSGEVGIESLSVPNAGWDDSSSARLLVSKLEVE
jgi:hypothetical protein